MIFVTAMAIINGEREPRQGWLIAPELDFIIGESGERYEIVDEATPVTNPPTYPSVEAMKALDENDGY